MAQNVIFKFGTQAQYDALMEKNPNALYWITDTQRLYRGEELFAVGAAASESAAGLLSAEDKAQLDSMIGTMDNKVDKDVFSPVGRARIFNEADGGGAKFEGVNGYASFAGVNSDVKDGIGAQLYDIEVESSQGAKLDVTARGIFYTTGQTSMLPAAQRDVEANEIVTRKEVSGLVGVLHFRGVFESLDDVTDPQNGDVVIVGNKEYVYVNIAGQPVGWKEFGDEGIYETKAEAAAEHAVLNAAVVAERERAIAEEAKKVNAVINGSTGVARIFNESDGGGAKFEHTDGTEAFVGVNNGGENGLMAQIYADKKVGDKWVGSRINVYHDKIFYTSKAAVLGGVAHNAPECEIATLGDIEAALTWQSM